MPRSSPAFGEKGGDAFDVLLVPENLRKRISNLKGKFQMIKAKEAKNRKRTTRKHPPFADIAKVGHRKIQGKFGIQWWATRRIYQHLLSRANRPGPSANLVSGCATFPGTITRTTFSQ